MNRNPFWFNKHNINTEVIMVGLAERRYRTGYYFVPRVEVPLQIFMKVRNLEKKTISGVATQLDKNLDGDTLDRMLLVHRFILPPLGKLFITFNFNGTNSANVASSLRVSRPFLSTVQKKYIIKTINKTIHNA
jgi:hypothetical protein